ncbi:MAG TPA: hypothetical protein VMS54_09230 [Vicinamibacterales bacterium]|nr:hypothetical protein [Vicinamibacterales bacterium]
MSALSRWLDPPAARERKQLLRGLDRGGADLEMGCLVPISLVLAVAIGIGVLIGSRHGSVSTLPTQAVVRVIDDGAQGGPKVLATVVVTTTPR